MPYADLVHRGEVIIAIRELWKIFGPDVEKVLRSELRFAAKETLLEKVGCVVALRSVSFEVREGETFVIMGLSGCGKSTLIRCILRLIEPTAGEIFIGKEDICHYNELELINLRRNTTSMVFQYFGLFPHRRVIDNVAYGLKVRGVSKEERYERAREMITKVGLKGWENYFPSTLSGGMQQRVGIARALATGAQILLMDEPFSGLDPLIRREMQNELLNIQREFRKTILFVTHDLREALKLGDRVAIMRDGEIIQIDTPERLITAPADEYVRQFVQDISPISVLVAKSIMSRPKILLHEWQEPEEAYNILKSNNIEGGFVVAETNKLLGLASIDLIVELIKRNRHSLTDALISGLSSCSPDTIVEDVLPIAVSINYPIPVVNDEGKLMGEIHVRDILESIAQREVNKSDA